MSEVERIADQLRRAHEGDAWHGPSVGELLAGVDSRAASTRPLSGAHSIWEIVLHLTTWVDTARRRIGGERAEPSAEEDWPRVPNPSEEAWRDAVATLETAYRRLSAAILELTDEDLEAPVIGYSYTTYGLLHGVIQHDLYHGGQIALLGVAASAV